MLGTNGANLVRGNSGNDTIFGRNGDDTLEGGGNDLMLGSTGADTFVFTGGADLVEDFIASDGDRIELDDGAIAAITGLTGQQIEDTFASVGNGEVVFDVGGSNTLTLSNLDDLTSLTDDIFVT